MKTINTTRKYLFVLLILIAIIILGFGFESTAEIALADQLNYSELTNELVQKFLYSDKFYNQLTDQESSLSTENIRNYYYNFWGTNVNGDDTIVMIIPKQIFWSVNSGTYIGEEYGFYFNTIIENSVFKTDIFVFDFILSSNLLTGEFFYKVEPLFVTKYTYSDSIGFVRPKDSTKVDYTNEYALNNVSYAFSVFNDNTPNYGNENYNKGTDSGAIIRQTRYNMDGLIYGTTDWETATNQMIDILAGALLETTIDLIVGMDPTGILSALKTMAATTAEIGQVVNGMYVYDVIDNITNNDLNMITYPDKNSYEVSESYARTARITASNSIAYCAKHLITDTANYSEGVLLLQDVGDPTRILSAISLNIVKFLENGNFQVIDSDVRCSEDLEYSTNETQEITCENTKDLYLYPNSKVNFVFTPAYSSYYDLIHNQSTGYSYRVYTIISNQEQTIYSGNNLNSIYLDKDSNYYIVITKVEGNWYQSSTLTICYKTLSLPITNVNIPAGKNIILKFVPDATEIIRLVTTNNNIKINKIHNLSTDTITEFNLSDTTDLFRINNLYLIELCNVLNENIQTDINKTSINIWNSQSFDPTTTSNYFSFTASEAGTIVFSFTYSLSQLNIVFFDNNFNSIDVNEYFGIGYKTIEIYLTKNQNIVIKITDLSNASETISTARSNKKNSYVWYVNNVACPSSQYQVKIGIQTALTISLHINNNITITNLLFSNKDSFHLATNNNTITFYSDCRVGGGVLGILARAENEEYYFGTQLEIIPVLNMTNIAYSFNDQDGFGFKWNGLNITQIKYNVIAGGSSSYSLISANNIANVSNLFATYTGYETIKIVSIFHKGKDYAGLDRTDEIYNGEKGLSCYDLSVHSKFEGGAGISSNPYIISCIRHFNNIPNNTTAYFIQTASIAFYDTATSRGKTFKGNYNANKKAFGRIVITSDSDNIIGGLFDINYGAISNIFLMTVTISLPASTGVIAGGIVGKNMSGGTISYCTVGFAAYNSINIGEGDMGGIAGINYGSITNVFADMTIQGYGDIGGLVGVNYGYIDDSGFDGVINYDNASNGNAGGIAGLNSSSGNIVNCRAYGCVNYTGTEDNDGWNLAPCLGKIIGKNQGTYANVNGNNTVNTGALKTLEKRWWDWGWKYYHWYQTQYAGNRDVGYQI